LTVTPAASSAGCPRVFGARPVATSNLSGAHRCALSRWSARIRRSWATCWLACAPAPRCLSARKAAVSLADGGAEERGACQDRDLRAERHASSNTTDEPITTRRAGMVSLTSASVEVQ
jgi:hypothetical protein